MISLVGNRIDEQPCIIVEGDRELIVHQNVQVRRIKRRLPSGKVLDEAVVRPSRREAIELLSALSKCNFAASALHAEMEHSLMLLKAARLEADTAVSIVSTSNNNATVREAAFSSLS